MWHLKPRKFWQSNARFVESYEFQDERFTHKNKNHRDIYIVYFWAFAKIFLLYIKSLCVCVCSLAMFLYLHPASLSAVNSYCGQQRQRQITSALTTQTSTGVLIRYQVCGLALILASLRLPLHSERDSSVSASSAHVVNVVKYTSYITLLELLYLL
jgi:hypothetical protein